jgi:hypothetical protein
MSDTTRHVSARFWILAVLASATGILFLITLLWRDWLEAFGVEPDGGSGLVEWLVVAALLAATVGLAAGARLEWRTSAVATGSV